MNTQISLQAALLVFVVTLPTIVSEDSLLALWEQHGSFVFSGQRY